MARASKKDQILDKGMRAVRRHGLVGSSVRDITAAAEVPLGSFGNHFASKEAFGIAVIDRYFEGVRGIVAETLDDLSRSPLERLRAYFDVITERLGAREWHDGCLIGNTSVDSVEASEAIRTHLVEVYAEWHEPFTRCLEDAAREQGVELPMPAADCADFLMASWQGAMLRMKVERSPAPLHRFKTVVFDALLVPRG
ncbi:TetR family transcriptional regulator C-terminal domain-containing protein [Yinghuangia seranimata]|uniref:TetR family transcriptional regulator C-terminal domain-containing protein n=1 Tax=Yinghuangia seranimata TaxID=408067 RepID=UPI00248C54D5|nr:TetR family transcriptional regulator C-terminal domain-containing protein [Yinghuangia seranimata]MDI2125893.1 TetR family transcriptional regulator C-terminal domain-containing protein [Yinghuangia seranimata]